MTATQSSEVNLLSALLGDSLAKIKDMTEKEITEMKTEFQSQLDVLKEQVKSELDCLDSDKPMVINLGTIEKPKKKLVHKAFNTITKILKSQKRKEKNIMLVGSAGGGKTHLVSMVADALKLNFYPMSVGLQTTKSDLLGFVNAQGKYVTSPVREAYENGGLLLLDEFDCAHAGVVTILNSLLANGHCSFPDGIVNKNPNFICICACNTYGRGANVDYVGRNRLDGATLDRFIVIDVDYDAKLEKKLCDNDAWFDIIKKIRANAEKQGIKTIISPRASMDGADLLDGGFTVKEVLNMTIFKGQDKDIQTKLLKDIDLEQFKKKKVEKDDTFPLPNPDESKEFSGLEILIDYTDGFIPNDETNEVYNLKIVKHGLPNDLNMIEASIGSDSIGKVNIRFSKNYTPFITHNNIYINTDLSFIRSFNGNIEQDFVDQIKPLINSLQNFADFDKLQSTLEYDIDLTIKLPNEEHNFLIRGNKDE